jgi:hypothetical protein
MATLSHKHDRVKEAIPNSVNEKIERDTWQRVADYANKSKEQISTRIEELNKEWDIERTLGMNMSTLALIGLALTYFVHINWIILSAVVLLFFVQHTLQGWCPPLPIMRYFKVRTSKEIEREKYALKILRGDFDTIPNAPSDVQQIKQAVTKT